MKTILMASACALALTASATTSGMAQSASSSTNAAANRDGVRVNSGQHVTTGSAAAAHNQSIYGGNPDAGGGPRGSVQSTNNPNASKEYGGR